MNIINLDGAVHVTLSERNLKDLLASLEVSDSARRTLFRSTPKGVLYVTAEDDIDHYTDRDAGPGLGFVEFGSGA